MSRKCVAFAAASPLRLSQHPTTSLATRRAKLHQTTLRRGRRARVSMMGPFFPDFSDSKLMKSEIVRKEMGSLERDYAELAKLGTRYEVRLHQSEA